MLGYLNADYFLGGEMKVNTEKARTAVNEVIAKPLGLSIEEGAAGIFRIINQNMADATKVVSVQRGHDPREYTLVSAGGACSIHACKIAEEVGSTSVLVPKAASVFCALGMLESDIRLDSVRTFNGMIPGLDLAAFNAVIADAEAKALEELLQEGVEKERASLLRYLDVRYVGQHHEVTIEIPEACVINEKDVAEITERFHRAHERLYTYSTPENPIGIMNLRITAVGAVEKTKVEKGKTGSADSAHALKGKRKAYFEELGGFIDTPVYDRGKLAPGNKVSAPAIIEERITTVIVHPGWELEVDAYGNIMMEVVK